MDGILINDLRATNDPSLSQTNGRITTWDKLQQYCPVIIKDSSSEVAVGTSYWKIVEIYIRTGVAEYIPKVHDKNGNPLDKYVVFRHWPSAPKLPPEVTYRPYDNAVGGLTNGDGDAGFPYGGGSVYVNGNGPDAIWVSPTVGKLDEPQASDVVRNLGWLGGSDHLTVNPVFQWTVKGGTLPPVTGDRMLFIYAADGTVFGRIALATGAGPTGQKKMVVMAGGEPVGYAIIQEPIE
jgi:hypothetical protein